MYFYPHKVSYFWKNVYQSGEIQTWYNAFKCFLANFMKRLSVRETNMKLLTIKESHLHNSRFPIVWHGGHGVHTPTSYNFFEPLSSSKPMPPWVPPPPPIFKNKAPPPSEKHPLPPYWNMKHPSIKWFQEKAQ